MLLIKFSASLQIISKVINQILTVNVFDYFLLNCSLLMVKIICFGGLNIRGINYINK